MKLRLRPWMLVSTIWLWPAVFHIVDRLLQVKLMGWDPPDANELLFMFGDWFGYAVFTPFIFMVAARWPVVRPHVRRRVLIQLGWALVFCLGWAVGGKLLQALLFATLRHAEFVKALSQFEAGTLATIAKNVLSWIMITIPFGVVVFATVSGMAHAISYFSEAREREVQVARLAEQLAGARFSALQAQLNPHFLFNTLNTIAVRARDGDGAGTARMVEQLSEMLRRTLESHRANEVMLDEEMELVRGYLAIEQARFSDRLRPTIEIAPGLGAAAVPSFAVQHLVENAIRHGIARRAEAGAVRVSVRRDGEVLDVSVADDGPGIAAGRDVVAGHGLQNTRDRLLALHGDRASLSVMADPAGGTRAVLRVPYRELVAEAHA